ncbi:kinase-like domain-containing protein [Haematococcus lacustris]
MQYAPCWWPSTSSNSSGPTEEGKHCKGHGNALEYQLQDHHQQQEQMPSTQTASSCMVQAGSNSSGAPDSHGTSSSSGVGHAAAVPTTSTPEAGPAAGPASQEHPSDTEARIPCSVAASTDLEQAGLEQELSLEEQLGTGAFGTVYRGRWRGMPVAVKRLVFSGLADQLDFTAQRQQVLTEAELNAGLAHPNLVATYAYHFAPVTNSSQSVADWALLMVCELCCFGSLTDAIDSGRLWDAQEQVPRMAQVLTILSDVAQGMAYVHSRNIIHRDLKPDNVLLQDSPDGVVAKVADLGLGVVLGRHQTHVSNACAGTPLYMAPEVLLGHSSQAGDVYSFGVMAWELLHGCTVWTRLQQITQEPRYLQGLAPHPKLFDHDWRRQPVGPAAAPLQPVLKGLQDLVDCCLLPRPSARPSSQQLVQWLVILVDVHGRQLHSL